MLKSNIPKQYIQYMLIHFNISLDIDNIHSINFDSKIIYNYITLIYHAITNLAQVPFGSQSVQM